MSARTQDRRSGSTERWGREWTIARASGLFVAAIDLPFGALVYIWLGWSGIAFYSACFILTSFALTVFGAWRESR